MQLPVNWSIIKVQALPQVGDFQNVIVRVSYKLSASETYQGHSADDAPDAPLRELTASVEDARVARFELDPENEFIPVENLTNEIVLDWVKAQLGEDAVLASEASVRQQIETIKDPAPSPLVTLNLPA